LPGVSACMSPAVTTKAAGPTPDPCIILAVILSRYDDCTLSLKK